MDQGKYCGGPADSNARVSTAATVKTGDSQNCRRAYRKLPGRFCIEHLFLLYAVQPRRVPMSSRLVNVAQFRLVLFY